MKLEYLYCKEALEEEAQITARLEAAASRMTLEEREAKNRANTARFQEIWEKYQSRNGHYDEHAFKIYQQLILETKGIAKGYCMDLKAEWHAESGWIELACDLLFSDSTANPLHLHLIRLFERCNSYSFMPTQRYGQSLVVLTFHFSFITYPFSDTLGEDDWE